jgi:predicted membrane chloride channel (bestrophin family)
MQLFYFLAGMFCHHHWLCHCHIIFVFCGSVDDNISCQLFLLFLWYMAELCMVHKSFVKIATCMTTGGLSVLLDVG